MNQSERRRFLIDRLLSEQPQYRQMQIPANAPEQRALLRALMNVRMPIAIGEDFLAVQNAYLQTVAAEKGIVSLDELTEIQSDMYLWRGDITRVKVGAIVNAANSGMTGCYQPNHNCIDNCIHTYAGIQLRLACAKLIAMQGHEEPTGQAKITPAYNLPCGFVLHTVGPIVEGKLTRNHEELLSSCYRSCLALALEKGIESVAFCCISTGVFMFPGKRAAEIAVQTVEDFKQNTSSRMKILFTVFKESDEQVYKGLLG